MKNITEPNERALDIALNLTFPASDPVAISTARIVEASHGDQPAVATKLFGNQGSTAFLASAR